MCHLTPKNVLSYEIIEKQAQNPGLPMVCTCYFSYLSFDMSSLCFTYPLLQIKQLIKICLQIWKHDKLQLFLVFRRDSFIQIKICGSIFSPRSYSSVALDKTSITIRGIPVNDTFFLSLILQFIEASGITVLSSFSCHWY